MGKRSRAKNWDSFFSGLVSGAATGVNLYNAYDANRRANAADVRAGEMHGIDKRIKESGLRVDEATEGNKIALSGLDVQKGQQAVDIGAENVKFAQSTTPGAISATNAENEATTKYAVSDAGLDNTAKGLANRYQELLNFWQPQRWGAELRAMGQTYDIRQYEQDKTESTDAASRVGIQMESGIAQRPSGDITSDDGTMAATLEILNSRETPAQLRSAYSLLTDPNVNMDANQRKELLANTVSKSLFIFDNAMDTTQALAKKMDGGYNEKAGGMIASHLNAAAAALPDQTKQLYFQASPSGVRVAMASIGRDEAGRPKLTGTKNLALVTYDQIASGEAQEFLKDRYVRQMDDMEMQMEDTAAAVEAKEKSLELAEKESNIYKNYNAGGRGGKGSISAELATQQTTGLTNPDPEMAKQEYNTAVAIQEALNVNSQTAIATARALRSEGYDVSNGNVVKGGVNYGPLTTFDANNPKPVQGIAP